jgi:hypothetical protein
LIRRDEPLFVWLFVRLLFAVGTNPMGDFAGIYTDSTIFLS